MAALRHDQPTIFLASATIASLLAEAGYVDEGAASPGPAKRIARRRPAAC